jgi:hypothetical protein
LDEEGNLRIVQGIPRVVSIKRNFSLAAEKKLQERMSNLCNSYGRGN